MALMAEVEPVSLSKVRKIKKLNDDNYSTWLLDMENVRDDLKLWDELDSDKESDQKLDKAVGQPKAGKQSWKAIMYSIEKSQFVLAEEPSCGLAAWKSLQKHHEKSGMTGRLAVLRSLLTFTWDTGSIDTHCSNLLSTIRKLARIGIVIKDDISIAILLNSLPQEYQPLVMALDAQGEEELELNTLIAKLKNLKGAQTMGATNVSALNARTESVADTSRRVPNRFQGKCHGCGKTGHMMKDCRSKGKSNRKHANHAAFAATTSRNLETGWIIDSGASAHMTGNLALLGSLKEVSPISVSIPNGRLYHANLSGRVTLGNGLQPNNVYYVPGFQKNLLSVSALDQVHNISFRNGSCYIDTARIAGRNANGLYEVTTHHGNAANTHETFGHISNRKLRELEKAGKIQAEDSSKFQSPLK